MSAPHLLKIDWSFAYDQTDAHVHGFHPYPARFIPQIPATLIRHLSEPGETVLDPFCGCGTTLVEALLQGRNAIGNDLNPIAVLVSKVKTTPLDKTRLSQLDGWLQGLENDQHRLAGRPTLFGNIEAELDPSDIVTPAIPNIDHWFTPEVKAELSLLSMRIRELQDKDIQDFCKVALSAILVGVSNQDSETRYSRRLKNIDAGETISRFKAKLADMRTRMLEFVELTGSSRPTSIRTICGDARALSIEPNGAHLIVTSPPYPNAFDYHLYHRFRIFWLGFDPVEMARSEIGSHLNYQRNGENMSGFIRDMTRSFVHLNQALQIGRYCCVVIGDSVFGGKVVKNDQIMTEIGERSGFQLEENIKRELPKVKRSFSAPARRLKEENIVILRKVSEQSMSDPVGVGIAK